MKLDQEAGINGADNPGVDPKKKKSVAIKFKPHQIKFGSTR